MPECRRSSIPDELIESKGRFKCDEDYLPTGNLIGYRTITLESSPQHGGRSVLRDTMPESFPMVLTTDEDEFKVWESQVFTTPDYIEIELIQNDNDYGVNPICDCSTCALGTNPPGWGTWVHYDANYWTGEVFNVGWYGRTIQFFFNLYKKYCCILNDKDDVIDFDYQYYYLVTQIVDGVPYGLYPNSGCDCGNTIKFCEPTFATWAYGNGQTCFVQVRNY
jgi:hypothetical protein